MPSIVDYPAVLARMSETGFECHYHNSGAFGFVDAHSARSIGWIGPRDDTIRAEVRLWTRQVPPPFPGNLARLVTAAWRHTGGNAWIMPMSHWAYELSHGNKDWLPDALMAIGIAAAALGERNNGAAVEFTAAEATAFTQFMEVLFAHLNGSDFAMAFLGKPIIATLHHHQQVWWTSTDAPFMSMVDALPGGLEPAM